MEEIDVVFRIFRDELIAIFPHVVENIYGDVMCYAHIGQHSTCDYKLIVANSKLATANEYNELKNELISIGYVLNIIKEQNYTKYLYEYRSILAK